MSDLHSTVVQSTQPNVRACVILHFSAFEPFDISSHSLYGYSVQLKSASTLSIFSTTFFHHAIQQRGQSIQARQYLGPGTSFLSPFTDPVAIQS